MPEDALVGFYRFRTLDDNERFLIANANAWDAPGLLKGRDDDFNGNFNPGNAVQAVGAAAARKAFRDQDPPDQSTDDTNDVFVEDFSLLDFFF